MTNVTKVTKQLKDLNLLDRFLFAEAMDDPENMKTLLDIILGQDTILKYLPQTEKETRTSPMNRFIRLDVYSLDMDETIYETEVQKENTKNLPRRSRLYQGMIDSKLLPPGSIDFNEMNNVFVIIIMPFDLFGYGLYRYTYRMMCEEIPGLNLNDGATRIFLNTRGTNPEGVSSELIELLHYMELSTDETSRTCQSERIHRLNDRISGIKSSEEIGVKFMQAWEEKILEKQKAHAEGLTEGLAEGLAKGHAEGLTEGLTKGHAEGLNKGLTEGFAKGHDQLLMNQIQKKLEKGYSPEEIADALEVDLSTVQQFMEQLTN